MAQADTAMRQLPVNHSKRAGRVNLSQSDKAHDFPSHSEVAYKGAPNSADLD